MTVTATTTARTTGAGAASPMTLSEDSIKDYLRRIGGTALLTAADEYALGERIEAGVLARQRLAESDCAGTELSAHQRRELLRASADGQRAKDHMVRANLRLVVSIAKRYPPATGMSMLDLVQEGTLGLMHAIDKFEHRRGFKLSTYATWWIKQAIGRALSERGRAVRLPSHVAEILNRVLRTERALSQRLGRAVTAQELAAELDLPVAQVRDLLGHAREPISLHTPIGEDDNADLGSLLPDPGPDPAAVATDGALGGELRRVLAGLPEREAQVIVLRYGLDGDAEPRTLEEVGRIFGVSRERVRQIEAKALGKLRQPARARALEGMLG
ncbi:RNA polymerase sigma factor RpoD/SigA [Nocardia sp. NPDC057668]|uniref:sigma-70 family RNA polymerase sigma factor n=1 Tax=Nocardia sp. NPDC057668 TaxID=3346202 RepID=UPI00366F2423